MILGNWSCSSSAGITARHDATGFRGFSQILIGGSGPGRMEPEMNPQ